MAFKAMAQNAKKNHLWFHLNQNIAYRFTCQQNLLNGSSKCGDMQDKVVFCIISDKVMQDLMLVLVEMFSNSHQSFLQGKTPRFSLKIIKHCCHFNTCGREGEVLPWDHWDEQGTRLAYDGE